MYFPDQVIIQEVLILQVPIHQVIHLLAALPQAQVQVQVPIRAAEVMQAEVINETKISKQE